MPRSGGPQEKRSGDRGWGGCAARQGRCPGGLSQHNRLRGRSGEQPQCSSALSPRMSGLCPGRPQQTADNVLTDEGPRRRWMKGAAHGHPAGEGHSLGPKPGHVPPESTLIPTTLWESQRNRCGVPPLNLSQQLHIKKLHILV